MTIKKLYTILGCLATITVLIAAWYKFDVCKVNKEAFAQFQNEHEDYVAMNDTRWLENYRRGLQQKIWDIQREFPTTYLNRVDYKQLVEELRLLEMKINAYYQRKGK